MFVSIERWWRREVTWIEQDDGSKAPQLCFIHLHVSHLWHQLCQDPEHIENTLVKTSSFTLFKNITLTFYINSCGEKDQ